MAYNSGGASVVYVTFGVSFASGSLVYSAAACGTATSATSLVNLTQTGFTVGGTTNHDNIKWLAIGI